MIYVSRGYNAIKVRIEGFLGERFFISWMNEFVRAFLKCLNQKQPIIV
jgi:hypothetical protein